MGPVVVDTAIPEAECRRGAREEVLAGSLFLPFTLLFPVTRGQSPGKSTWVIMSTRVGTGTRRRGWRTENEWQKRKEKQ